eukprot:Lankesteria_metandrocarpae@DN9420_c0_g1_i1.p1
MDAHRLLTPSLETVPPKSAFECGYTVVNPSVGGTVRLSAKFAPAGTDTSATAAPVPHLGAVSVIDARIEVYDPLAFSAVTEFPWSPPKPHFISGNAGVPTTRHTNTTGTDNGTAGTSSSQHRDR